MTHRPHFFDPAAFARRLLHKSTAPSAFTHFCKLIPDQKKHHRRMWEKFAIEFIVTKEINVVCNEIVLCLTLCSRKDL